MKRLIIVGLVLLTGCGPSTLDQKAANGKLDVSNDVLRVEYKNKPLNCLYVEEGMGDTSRIGVSCDWVEYHNLDNAR